MSDTAKYEDMLANGSTAVEVYHSAKRDGLVGAALVRTIRKVLRLSFVEYKQFWAQTEHQMSLEHYQERFQGAIDKLSCGEDNEGGDLL